MEKIYSRRKFKFPRINKFKLILVLIFLLILSIIISFIYAAYPIFEATCKNRASSIAISVATEEVNNVMSNYEYEDLVDVQKSEDGNITMIKAKIVPINEMISKITYNIKKEIDKKEQVEVCINMGAVTGFSGLSAVGPKFSVKMEASRSELQQNLIQNLHQFGINQTLHRIYLDITTKTSILTPFNIIRSDYESRVLLTESIIVGSVPDTYYYYDNLTKDEVLDTN